MIKVTRFENNGERVLLKDNGVKVEFINGIVKVYDEKGKKVVKTLKSEKTMKKYVEVIESYKAKKGLNEVQQKMDVEENEGKNEVVEQVEKSSVEKYIEKKSQKQQEVVEQVEIVEEAQKEEEKVINEVVVVEEEKEEKKNNKDWEKDFFKNIDRIPLTTKTMVIDATCKAHKENIDGVTTRFTRFTIFLTTDNKDLNDGLINSLVCIMEKEMLDNFGYDICFDRETLISYARGKDICHEMTLTIPLMGGMSEIRKNICTCYYASKKKVQAFYKEVKAWKLRQEAEAKKKQSA